jgi:hypothetical protein
MVGTNAPTDTKLHKSHKSAILPYSWQRRRFVKFALLLTASKILVSTPGAMAASVAEPPNSQFPNNLLPTPAGIGDRAQLSIAAFYHLGMLI